MGDYLRNSLFAGHLLEYVFREHYIEWESPYAPILGQDCQGYQFEEICTSVRTIIKKNNEDIDACYLELRKAGIDNKEAFGKCALSAANSYFLKSYSPGSFLGYCAIVLGAATCYFEYPPNGVPEMAVDVVALVLFAHQLTGEFYRHDGWEGLRKTSRLLNVVCGTN